jgi:hypothetical protein
MDFGISEAYLAYAAVAATAVGAGVSAVQAHQASVARAQAMQYNAAVAQNNQKVAKSYADMEIQRGQQLEEEKRRETAQRQGMIRVAGGASGIDVNTGSPVRLAEDTAKLGELDAQTIRSNSARAAYGYQVKGMDYAAQANLDMMAANDASKAGELGEWSSLIGGAASVSDKWLRYKEAGIG